MSAARIAMLGIALLAAGCATRRLPDFQKPLPRSEFQRVRTTAYTDTEADHKRYRNLSAAGTPLRCGPVASAAADWARWPLGTVFRIVQSGRVYTVDDYGWALSGTNTIDLYMPTRQTMNAWATRTVDIQILEWGDLDRSYRILRPRRKYRHVGRMLKEIEAQRQAGG